MPKAHPVDVTQLTYRQMADLVDAIRHEVKARNPIFVNVYVRPIRAAVAALDEISGGESSNRTSESGPRESKRVNPKRLG